MQHLLLLHYLQKDKYKNLISRNKRKSLISLKIYYQEEDQIDARLQLAAMKRV